MEKKIFDGDSFDAEEDFTVTCDIIRDLMPLAADGVASEDSEAALRRHIQHCEECRRLFEEFGGPNTEKSEVAPNDRKIMAYIRRQAVFLIGFVAVLVAAIGIMMIETSLTFQNLLIMPIVGVLSYCCFKKKGFFISGVVFLLTTARGLVQWQTLSLYFNESETYDYTLSNAIVYGVILGVLALVGATIAALLDFAFSKSEH